MVKERSATGKNRRIINDVIVALLALLISGAIFLIIHFSAEDGLSVKVTVDGEIFGEYSLDKNITVDIITGEGENKNTLKIENGVAFIAYADCPDLTCAHHAPISKSGQTIICLPHKIVILIEGESSDVADL